MDLASFIDHHIDAAKRERLFAIRLAIWNQYVVCLPYNEPGQPGDPSYPRIPYQGSIDALHEFVINRYWREYNAYISSTNAVWIEWSHVKFTAYDAMSVYTCLVWYGLPHCKPKDEGNYAGKLMLLYEFTRYEPIRRFVSITTTRELRAVLAMHEDEIKSRIVFRNVPILFKIEPRLPVELIKMVTTFL